MPEIADLLEQPGTTVAVVGATDDPDKYGSRIYRDLKAKGFPVFPVNPGRRTVDGDPAYASLADLPEPPTIINLVVPPPNAFEVIRRAHALGLDRFWLQPGSESPEALEYLSEQGLSHLSGECIMVRSRAAV